ncbi:integral membrane protein [Streptomyces zinciresistens K42]|uniref:Integral membrane protein n=1 Tax=Streptomyces zinciresistens K42 TaxID=700597 RepID=G2GF18_9ACTN|nr:hypothetical protein [Streptomyces zinciresistens]EGX57885.1 integral membrane protein [Streptomyces zinciresistens K42]
MNAVLALARHEARLLASLGLWAARRTRGAGEGVAFGYARGQGTMMFGLAFVIVIESVMMSLLLRNHPVVQRVWFLADVYALVLVVGTHAASVVRPHVLGADGLRVRRAAHVDLRVPVERIARVRRELRTTHEPAEGELNLAVGSQTTVTLELSEPVPHVTLLGRRQDVRRVRLYAEDADALVRAVEAARTVAADGP